MSRSGVSKQQVILAAQKLLRNSENPTVFKVREELQTGSHSTINRYLNEWKSEILLGELKNRGLTETQPDPVNQAVNQVWVTLQHEAETKIQALQTEYENKIAKLLQYQDELAISLRSTHEQLNQTAETLTRLQQEHAKTMLLLDENSRALIVERADKDKYQLLSEKLATERKIQISEALESKEILIQELKLELKATYEKFEQELKCFRDQSHDKQQGLMVQVVNLKDEIAKRGQDLAVARQENSGLKLENQRAQGINKELMFKIAILEEKITELTQNIRIISELQIKQQQQFVDVAEKTTAMLAQQYELLHNFKLHEHD